MTIKIPLRLYGIDLRQADAYDRIPPDLAELGWEADGGVSLVVFYSDDPAHVAAQSAAARAKDIARLMPGVTVAYVHDELVSVPDIAARTSVAAETVRLWTVGKRRSAKPFPPPRQVIGRDSSGKSMSLFAWREVLSWIRDVIGEDPDEDIKYLADDQIVALNAEFIGSATASGWHETHLDARANDACGSPSRL